MENNQHEEGISLIDIFNILKKNILIIIISILVAIILGFIYVFTIATPTYQSKCLVMVQFDNPTSSTSDVSNSLRIVATVAGFMEDDMVIDKAVGTLKEKGIEITNKEIKDGFNTSYSTTSLNITVTYENENKEICDDVLNTVIKSAEHLANNTLNEEGEPYYPSIKNAISQIGVAGEAKDVSMSKKIVLVIFAMAGLIIGFVITFVKELLNTSVVSKEDIENITNVQVIGSIPEIMLVKGGKE